MQLPIILGLRRSRLWAVMFAGLAMLSALVLIVTPWPPVGHGLAALAWCLIVGQGARQWRRPLPALRLSDNGELAICLPGATAFVPVTRLTGVAAHPWLVLIRWKIDDVPGSVCLLPDTLPPDQWRALCVWLRWRAAWVETRDVCP